MLASTEPDVLPGRSWGRARQQGGKTRPGQRRQRSMTIHRVSGPCLANGPPADVVDWRRCLLLGAGFDHELASRLAVTREVDVHALLELVDRGCPPPLAARILSPDSAP